MHKEVAHYAHIPSCALCSLAYLLLVDPSTWAGMYTVWWQAVRKFDSCR